MQRTPLINEFQKRVEKKREKLGSTTPFFFLLAAVRFSPVRGNWPREIKEISDSTLLLFFYVIN